MSNIEREKMNQDKYFCEVNIFGEKFKLVSKDADFDKLEQTAHEVDKQMKQIAKKYPEISKFKVAILVALNITDNLYRLKENISNIENSNSNDENNLTSSKKTYIINEEYIVMRIEKLIDDIKEVLN